MRTRSAVAVGLAVALAVTLAACGSTGGVDGANGGAVAGPAYRIPTSTVDVPLDAVSWMQGSVLHVDGRSLDTGVRAESYALVPDGVLLSRAGTLSFSDTRSRATTVGTGVVGPDGVQVSPDGRHVGFLDDRYGPKDSDGRHYFRLDVLDTRTGRQVLSSTKGMGDPSEPVAEQYEERDPSLTGLDDSAAYVGGVGGSYRYPLDGGAPRRRDAAPVQGADHGGTAVSMGRLRSTGLWRTGTGGYLGNLAPSGHTALADTLNVTFTPYDVRTGRPLRFRTLPGVNRFALGGWLTGDDFWGFAFRGDSAAVVGTGRIVSCSRERLVCAPISPMLTSADGSPVLVDGASTEN